MDKFISGELTDPRLQSGDSVADRISCRHTVALFFLFSIVVTLKQHYVGEPITCWHPEHFTSSHEHYVNSLCWVNNTYFLPFNQSIPKENEEKKFIGYYQWTSLILCCMAIMFLCPRLLWMTLNKKSGVEITTITGASIECLNKHDSEDRRKTMEYMINHMSRFLGEVTGKLMLPGRLKSFWWHAYGSYLAVLYLIIKVFYVFNAVSQLLLLDHMLGLREHMHGLNFLRKLVDDDANAIESPLFPRVAMCDFKIRVLGNVQRYTVQCSLPINLFNEKIFIVVWMWLVFVVVTSVTSLIIWTWKAMWMGQHMKYIKTRLISLEKLGNASNNKIHDFVREYLRRDGMFIIYLVGINSSDLVASELVVGLWQKYLKLKRPTFSLGAKQDEAWADDVDLSQLNEMEKIITEQENADSEADAQKEADSKLPYSLLPGARRGSILARQVPLDVPDGNVLPSKTDPKSVSFAKGDDEKDKSSSGASNKSSADSVYFDAK